MYPSGKFKAFDADSCCNRLSDDKKVRIEDDDTRRGMEIGAYVADSCPVAWGARGSPV